MIVRSGKVTGSPKASPGCKGDGDAPDLGGAGGGIGSLAPDFGAGLWAAAMLTAKASTMASATATTLEASLKGDITVLRRLRRPGDSPAYLRILAWPLVNPRLFAI